MRSLPNLSNAEKKALEEITTNVWKKERFCNHSGCRKKAASNHLMQENGVLDLICDGDRKVWQVENNHAYSSDAFRFRHNSISGGQVLTFPWFCEQHDNDVFKPIEVASRDFLNNYHHILLQSYRALLYRIFDTLRTVEINKLIQTSPTISKKNKDAYLPKLKTYTEALKTLYEFKKLMEAELNKSWLSFLFPKINIAFVTRELPNLQTAASGCWLEAGIMEDESQIYCLKFVHVIPSQKGSTMIIGSTEANFPIEGFPFSDIGKGNILFYQRLLTNLLSKYITSWCISTHFYASLHSKGLDSRIMQNINRASKNQVSHDVGFEMFGVMI